MEKAGRVINVGVDKMQIQEVAKGRDKIGNKTKVTTASDVWMSIIILLER